MMAKHGNNSSTSLSGSADLLQRAPNPPVISATTAENLPSIYAQSNYAFLYAREWHPGMKYAAAVRKEVPVRTIFNLLGPLSNPAGVTRLLVGAYSPDWLEPLARVLGTLGAERAWLVHGADGLDEGAAHSEFTPRSPRYFSMAGSSRRSAAVWSTTAAFFEVPKARMLPRPP